MGEAVRPTMERPAGDVSLAEIAGRLKIIVAVVGLLVIAELAYRWLTHPDDSFALYQELLTWAWYHMHGLIFGPETVSYVANDGPNTILEFYHPSFEGSAMNPLEVTDECVGLHEIAFVSFMIWMTPGISRALKKKGILTMAGVLITLNLARLLVLYPLAVNGCVEAPGQYGCWAPMWEFHEFMLDIGFMLVILIGWTGWFLSVGGPKKMEEMGDINLRFALPTKISQRSPLPQSLIAVLLVTAIFASSAAYTLSFDDNAEKERLEAEGCEGIILALCAEEVRDWDNISGRAWRTMLVSAIVAAFSLTKLEWGNNSTEEEE
jgi:exosortase/archaeosortase family protein